MIRDVFQFGLSVVGLLWYLVMWALSLLGCIIARRRYRYTLQPSSAISDNAPAVSILRPLKGLDTNLYENLESSFNQKYPDFEIIFSVADEDDEALTVVDALRNRYPQVKTSIIIGEEVVGVNPKVNNLVRSFRQAAHDILWVVDSGVIVDEGTLARSVAALVASNSTCSPRIGVVHHVPFALVDNNDFGSHLEAAFLNTNHAKMYIAINTLGVESCVVGKSNLYRRSDIQRVNGSLAPSRLQVLNGHEPTADFGLAAFGRFLAEDNMIASAIWHELGLRHDLSCDVARNVIGNMSFLDYVWRRVRWIRVRKHMVIAATILEPFTESVLLCAIAALSCRKLFGFSMWIFTLFHFVFWLSIDLDVYSSVGGQRAGHRNKFSFIFSWLARELLALPIFLIAVVGNEISWRGRRYKVTRSGEASVLQSKEYPSLRMPATDSTT